MYRGVITPAVTLFKDDGAVDLERNRRFQDFLIEHGVDGLFVLGTTGEFMHMNLREREQFAQATVEHVAGRLPVIVGAGSTSTAETIRLSRHAQAVGADAVAIITPYFWALSEREVVGHLSAVAIAIDIPLFVYNYPAYSGHNISDETLVALLREHPNIVGVIDAIDSLEHLRRRVHAVKSVSPDFRVLAGSDPHLLTILQIGGDGTVPATSNFAPDRHTAVFRAYSRGEYEQAIHLLPDLFACTNVYRVQGSFHSVTKEAMTMVGVCQANAPRPPALPLAAEARARLRETLQRANLIPGTDN